jgi:DNA invertase Pin-like site-specific DNA recombinase
MALSAVSSPEDVLVGIYSRISSDDDTRVKQLGVKRQEKACRALVEAQGWVLVDVYCDNNRSASKEDAQRPEFDRMLTDLRRGRINRVVVLGQDRLVRKPEELESTMRLLRKLGIAEIQTVTDGVVNIGTTTGRTMARVKGVFDIAYAEYISEKVRQKKDELAEAGMPAGGGSRPFGFQADKMTVVPEEAELIRSAAKRTLDGDTLHAICADWKAAGVRTVTGREWLPNVLRGILTSPRIAGLRQHRGEVAGTAAWPAIIDLDTRERLLAVFNAPGRRRAEIEGTRLLTGLLRCGRPGCGGRLLSGMNNGLRAYVCRGGPGKDGCNRLAMIAEPLEDLLVEAVLIRLGSPAFGAALASQRATDGDRQDLNRIAELEGRLDELADMFAVGEIDRRGYTRAKANLDAELRTARRRVARQQAHSALDPFLDDPEHVRARWAAADPKTAEGMRVRRAVMAAMLEEVVIGPALVRGRHAFDADRVDPRWRA